MTRAIDPLWPWLALIAALAPASRAWFETDMARHMLLQFPLLVAIGVALGASFPPRWHRVIDTCNAHGATGLLFASLVLGFWMLPRTLDLAVQVPAMALAKYTSLLLAGVALRWSWPAAGTIVQLFFVGNGAWMSATAGLLYQSLPQRLCTVYLLDQQVIAGRGLVATAVLVPLLWLVLGGGRLWFDDDSIPVATHLSNRVDA